MCTKGIRNCCMIWRKSSESIARPKAKFSSRMRQDQLQTDEHFYVDIADKPVKTCSATRNLHQEDPDYYAPMSPQPSAANQNWFEPSNTKDQNKSRRPVSNSVPAGNGISEVAGDRKYVEMNAGYQNVPDAKFTKYRETQYEICDLEESRSTDQSKREPQNNIYEPTFAIRE